MERCRAQRGRLAGFYAYEVAENKITVILLNLLQKRFKKCRRYGVIGIDKADECPACRKQTRVSRTAEAAVWLMQNAYAAVLFFEPRAQYGACIGRAVIDK